LSCPPSSEITEIQNFRLCNGSTLSIKFNVSESCNNIISQVFLYIYQYSTSFGGNARSHVSWEYFQYSDILCGITARLGSPLIINVDGFNRTNLLQIRLREIFSGSSETCSNTFHVFLDYTGFLGPPVSINSYSDSCSTIGVTWSDPNYQCGIEPVYYNLSIYDDITDSLVTTVAVYDTSYQFVDSNLFRHCYTYVITGVNELGEGISNNDTFSYQRVPRLVVQDTTLEISNYTQDMAIMQYHTQVTLECTGEAPENATVIIECNGTGVVYDDTALVEYAKQPNNITGSVPVPQYQQCTLSVVFSNEAGSSEPFILAF
uniref:Fibronectin type-III domain-containing protein n=1 Tax=Amphimedon queenslandica TaxID=400682 RepID=A0A1X7TVI5_AMPQE